MAIQNRRGVYSDFTPTKMVPGEFAVVNSGDPNSTTGKGVYISFADGQAKRLIMEEDVQNEVAKATEDIAQELTQEVEAAIADDVQAAQTAATNASTSAQTATTKASEAAASATQAAQTVANIIDNTLTQTGKAADAKVVGDELSGVKNDLNTLNTQINGGTILAPVSKTVNDFTLTGYYIDATSLEWVYHANNNRGYWISLDGYAKIKITANASKASQIAFLTDFDPVIGNAANFAANTSLIIISPNDVYESDVPSDATCLYMRRIDQSGYNLDPQSIVFYVEQQSGESISGDVETLKQDVMSLNGECQHLNTQINDTETISQTIQVSDLTMDGYYIDATSLKWAYSQNGNRGYHFEIGGYSKVKITAPTFSATKPRTEFAFLTGYNPVTGETPLFSEDTSLYRLQSQEVLEVEVPNDAEYIYFRRINADGVNVTPASIEAYTERYTDESIMGKCEKIDDITSIVHFRISTYNTGDFSGMDLVPRADETALLYRKIIAKVDAPIIAIQEDTQYFAETETAYDVLYSPMFKFNKLIGSSGFNYYDCISDYQLVSASDIPFTSYQYHTHFSHYIINVQGINVNIINIHLDWYDKTMRHNQIAQILTYISNMDHVIVLGDFNPADRTNGVYNDPNNLYMWDEDYAIWTNAGYTIANCGALGEYNTCLSDQGGYWFPCDQIVVSNDITVKAVGVIKEDWSNDHIPLFADLCVYTSN